MTEPRKSTDMPGLEAFFDAARETEEAPAPEFLARVLADAEAVQAGFARRESPKADLTAPRRAGALRALREVLGGWPGLAGLGMAGLAGLWIGVAPPAALDGLAAGLMGLEGTVYSVDPVSGFGFDLVEG